MLHWNGMHVYKYNIKNVLVLFVWWWWCHARQLNFINDSLRNDEYWLILLFFCYYFFHTAADATGKRVSIGLFEVLSVIDIVREKWRKKKSKPYKQSCWKKSAGCSIWILWKHFQIVVFLFVPPNMSTRRNILSK